MKRILSIVMVILMILGSVPPAVCAAEDPVITVRPDKTEATIGETLEMTYYLTDNPGFTNTDLRLTFDQKVLRFTGLKRMKVGGMQFVDGALVAAVVNTDEEKDGYGLIAYAGEEAFTTDDYHLFIAIFEVIGAGETTVGAEIITFGYSEITEEGKQQWKDIPTPSVIPATVSAKAPHIHEYEIKYDPEKHWYECGCGDKINEAGHDGNVTVPGKAATCTEPGLTDGKKCSICGNVTVEQTETEKLAHSEETIPGKDATCKETGLTEGKKCTVCGETLKEQEVIEKSAHDEETIPGKPATYTQTGLTEGKKCTVCGEVTLKQEVIPVLATQIESLTIESTASEIYEGETVTLSAVVKPESVSEEYVIWTSSDEDIATVEKGVVSALKAGTVIITATAGEKSDSCTVVVKEKEIPVQTVTIDRKTAEIAEGHSIILTATVTPSGATDKTVVWTTSDESVATVENGFVTGVSTGNAVITATAGGMKAECSVTVKEESLMPGYEIEVVLDRDEYKENQDVVAKVYLKKLLEDESTANVFGYALSFNDNSFVLKDAVAESGLVDELSTVGEGIVVRKLRLCEGEGNELSGIPREGLLIDTLTFKAVRGGTLNAGFTEVDGDVDLEDAGVFVSVFMKDYVYAESIPAKGTVSYTGASGVVEDYISQIGNTVEFGDFALMKNAKEAYDELEDYEKGYVENISVLEITERYYELWKTGDVNVDGTVSSQDLSMILGTYAQEVSEKNACCDVKPDGDSEGHIDGGDLSVVIGHYGTAIKL